MLPEDLLREIERLLEIEAEAQIERDAEAYERLLERDTDVYYELADEGYHLEQIQAILAPDNPFMSEPGVEELTASELINLILKRFPREEEESDEEESNEEESNEEESNEEESNEEESNEEESNDESDDEESIWENHFGDDS